jgi:hypothetical protein
MKNLLLCLQLALLVAAGAAAADCALLLPAIAAAGRQCFCALAHHPSCLGAAGWRMRQTVMAELLLVLAVALALQMCGRYRHC